MAVGYLHDWRGVDLTTKHHELLSIGYPDPVVANGQTDIWLLMIPKLADTSRLAFLHR